MRDLDEVIASMTTEEHRVSLQAIERVNKTYGAKATLWMFVLVLEVVGALWLILLAVYTGVTMPVIVAAIALALSLVSTYRLKRMADTTWKSIVDRRDELRAAWERRQEMLG